MDQLRLSNGMFIAPEMSHPDYYEATPTNVFSMEKTDLSHLISYKYYSLPVWSI